MSPGVAAIVLLLVIAGLIGNAIQSCSGPATPSTDGAAATTDPPTPAPTTAPTPAPLDSSHAAGASAPQVATNSDDDARKDVTLLNCSWKTDPYNTTQATVNVRVVNHTDSAQFYEVEVGLSNAQGQPVGTVTAIAQSLPSGGSVTVTGSTYPDGPVSGMRCQVADVTRIPMATGSTLPGDGAPDLGVPHVYVPHPDLEPFHIHLHVGHGHR